MGKLDKDDKVMKLKITANLNSSVIIGSKNSVGPRAEQKCKK